MATRAIPVLAFVGAPASGKTEAALVAKDLGIPVITMGDVIRDELRRRNLPATDENAGRIATELRTREGDDAIAKRCIPLIEGITSDVEKQQGRTVIVIDGIRGIAEVDLFKKTLGPEFTLVRIETPLRRRFERIKARGRADDELRFEEFEQREVRERGWGMGDAMDAADMVIHNVGSLDAFRDQIKALLNVK